MAHNYGLLTFSAFEGFSEVSPFGLVFGRLLIGNVPKDCKTVGEAQRRYLATPLKNDRGNAKTTRIMQELLMGASVFARSDFELLWGYSSLLFRVTWLSSTFGRLAQLA